MADNMMGQAHAIILDSDEDEKGPSATGVMTVTCSSINDVDADDEFSP